MKLEYDAIVLLGRRNAGKDTVCGEIQSLIKATNVKFSAFGKLMIANALFADLSLLENKEQRVKPIEYIPGQKLSATPLDLLNALYHGSEQVTAVKKAGVEFAFGNLKEGHIPVFTDIRREYELFSVVERFGVDRVLICMLDCDNGSPYFREDAFVETWDKSLIAEDGDPYAWLRSRAYRFSKERCSAKEIAEEIVYKNLQAQKNEARVLVIHTDDYSIPKYSERYEPLRLYVEEVQKLGERLNLLPTECMSLFQALVSMLDANEIKLAPLNVGFNHMLYFKEQHKRMLPQLIALADRVVYADTIVYP